MKMDLVYICTHSLFNAGQSVSTPSGSLFLQLAGSYDLRKKGVLEISSTDIKKMATYGLVWKVAVNDSLMYYIPQV